MFYNCRNLKYLDSYFFEIKNDINVNYMLELCNNLNISSFIKKNESNNKYENVISILINIDKNDKKKEIYFLDNYEYKDNEGMIHYHDNLKELNEFNTKLYIDDVENEYKKYFIPKKKGTYNIKLKFNINLIDCSYMFAGCENILEIDFISFNSIKVLNMKSMFYDCKINKKINTIQIII